MRNKVILSLCIILQISLLCGCWSKKELDEISILSGIGIDNTDDDKLLLTMQVILHREMKIESQSGKRGEERPTQNVEVIGDSLIDANRNFILQTGRRGYWSHVSVIVIGEELAKKGISPILDVLERDNEIRQRTLVLVAKGEAKEILMGETIDLEVIQAYNIKDMIRIAHNDGKSVKVDLRNYFLMSSKESYSSFIPGINIIQTNGSRNGNIELKDTGIFKENKLVGWFNETETRGLLWILDDIQSCITEVNYPKEKCNSVFIEVLRSRTKVEPVIKNNTLEKIVLNVSASGKIAQSNEYVDITKTKVISEIGKATEEVITKKMIGTIKKGKSLNVDIFGFGEAIYKKNPKLWKEMEEYWEDIFLSIPVEVNVNMEIKRTGLISKSKKDKGM
ncbi:Ger(x)C family spore germination protein [Vallitalea guaymasensis]|uniref:Ger(x)C family spore germination protein n=1 Tax=Vallitalea guaymasensis TaxID=1185412 RepID=UPI002354F6DD|nr:Ger(x)C family spore germination protein [Vallitalea guaymasensis]